MKKLVLSLSIFLIALGIVACGGAKYTDAKGVMLKYADSTEAYLAAIEKVENASDMAKALNDYAAALKEVAPQMKEMRKKYPEIKSKPPEELKEITNRLGQSMSKMMKVSMKFVQYANDPEVQKAQRAYGQIMSSMR